MAEEDGDKTKQGIKTRIENETSAEWHRDKIIEIKDEEALGVCEDEEDKSTKTMKQLTAERKKENTFPLFTYRNKDIGPPPKLIPINAARQQSTEN